MLRNYLTIALRNLSRNKVFSFVNILGLAAGLTTFLGICLYVAHEYSFDRFHEKADRIYQVITTAKFNGQEKKWSKVPNKIATTAAVEVPEVEKAARIFHHDFGATAFITVDTLQIGEDFLIWADPTVFDILSIDLIRGDTKTPIAKPNTVAISTSAAKKYFGDNDPIGRTLKVDNDQELQVTAVFRDMPSNSRYTFQLIATFQSDWFGMEKNQSWSNASFETLLLLHEGSSALDAQTHIQEMVERHVPEDSRWFTLSLKALTDVHLHSSDLSEDPSDVRRGDLAQLRLLTALSFIILLIASINYMNLTTAQAQRRHKEVGINKTLGATAAQLSRKFFAEAGLFILVAMIISVMLFLILLPAFNDITNKQITHEFLITPWFWGSFATLWVILTLLSGAYPALYLSSFSPRSILQRSSAGASGNVAIRKVLVVFQFTVSVVLIAGTLVLYRQLDYVRTTKLGFEPEQVVAVTISGAEKSEQVESLKKAYEHLPMVSNVCKAQSFPGRPTSGRSISLPSTNEGVSILTTRATPEIIDVLKIKLLAGKTLPEKTTGDTTIQVILNKVAIDYLGMSPEDAIGRKITINGFDNPVEIVGVTENFHSSSMHASIGLYCFHNAPTERMNFLLVKINTTDLPAAIGSLKRTFKDILPSAFEFNFLDEHMHSLYTNEARLANVVLLFSSLAIIIACLGLYALAAYTAEQRTKEIGIRKVLGASTSRIITMLTKDFLVLVLIAFVIGAPLSYYFTNEWLESFAYRIEIGAGIFIVVALVVMAIAWITVGIESARAAMANPVNALKSE